MSIEITEVKDRADLKRWVEVPYTLYKNHPYQVPQLFMDELAYFDSARNPAFEVCETRFFLAADGGKPLGRVCAIINSLETEKLGRKRGRFGWFECVDNQKTANLLLDSVKTWLSAEQCVEMTGPHGFTDLDPEGLLVEGFDRIPTISGSYNYPYYRDLLEGYGLDKDVDYVEYRCEIPDEFPLFERLRKRYSGKNAYRIVTCRSRRELRSHIGKMWGLMEEAFADLYGVTPLTGKQKDFYAKKYFGFLDPEFVKLTYNPAGEMVGFFIGIPNMSRGFKKAGGRLFPFGLLNILRDYRRPETVDFLLAGVKPGESTAVITAVTFIDMYDTLRKRGVKFMETNRELEENTSVNGIWLKFPTDYFRRSRIFRTPLS